MSAYLLKARLFAGCILAVFLTFPMGAMRSNPRPQAYPAYQAGVAALSGNDFNIARTEFDAI